MKKLIVIIVICLVGYALLMQITNDTPDIESYSYTGYSDYTDTNSSTINRTEDDTTVSQEIIEEDLPRAAKYIPDQSVCYHYHQLDKYGKEIYNNLLKSAANGSSRFEFKLNYDGSYYEDSFENAVYGFVMDHPEFFWLRKGYSYSYNGNIMKLVIAVGDFWNISMFHEKYTEPFFDKVDYIVSEAAKYDSDYEKALFTHDYLASITTYDYAAADDNDDGDWSIQSDYAYSSYGGLINGKWVCAGYAAAFQLIMQQLGIECAYVSGDSPEGSHAWNLIRIGSEYYWIDLTWDDVDDWTTSDGKITYLDGVNHCYFALTDNQFFTEHTPEYFEYPNCGSIYYNYHNCEGYYIRSYSETEINNAFIRQIAEGKTDITLKFSDKEVFQKAYYDYLWSGAAYELLNSYGYYGDYTWYRYDDLYVVDCCLLEHYN